LELRGRGRVIRDREHSNDREKRLESYTTHAGAKPIGRTGTDATSADQIKKEPAASPTLRTDFDRFLISEALPPPLSPAVQPQPKGQ